MARIDHDVMGADVRAPAGTRRQRITDAAIRCIVRDGMGGASMADIAAEGHVSKALLHYHFADRSQLLAGVATALGNRMAAREHFAVEGHSGTNPVDVVWRWTQDELDRGELRALLALATVHDAGVRVALTRITEQRRRAAITMVSHVFRRLGLTPRIDAGLVADATMTVLDGLAMNHGRGIRDSQSSFDVFWLALLNMGR